MMINTFIRLAGMIITSCWELGIDHWSTQQHTVAGNQTRAQSRARRMTKLALSAAVFLLSSLFSAVVS